MEKVLKPLMHNKPLNQHAQQRRLKRVFTFRCLYLQEFIYGIYEMGTAGPDVVDAQAGCVFRVRTCRKVFFHSTQNICFSFVFYILQDS